MTLRSAMRQVEFNIERNIGLQVKNMSYTQRINKVALSINDDKRIQDNDRNKIYAYGTSVCIICKEELVKITRNLERVVNWCLNQNYECGLRQLATSKIIKTVNM